MWANLAVTVAVAVAALALPVWFAWQTERDVRRGKMPKGGDGWLGPIENAFHPAAEFRRAESQAPSVNHEIANEDGGLPDDWHGVMVLRMD
ncbi:MAG: hypothetical protein LBK95_17665 [Bifidobacteriaceae bacterium]|jgi:hypothetical protein|nr:hypothetical protein [Bifidobacteriaceae bacterium]